MTKPFNKLSLPLQEVSCLLFQNSYLCLNKAKALHILYIPFHNLKHIESKCYYHSNVNIFNYIWELAIVIICFDKWST